MHPVIKRVFGIGVSTNELDFIHLSSRAFLVCFMGMFLVRVQAHYMNVNTPFSYMANITVGSLLANAIIGEGDYFAVLSMCLLITGVNWTIAYLCYHIPFVAKIFKGESDILVHNGKINWKNMRKNLVTKDELLEVVHQAIHSSDLSLVKKAYFETNGEITIVTE